MSAEELQRRRHVRRAHRAAITKVAMQINELCVEDSPDITKLRAKKQVLEQKRDTVKEMDTEILVLVPDDELEGEVERADEVLEQIDHALILVDD
jgi:hypothetical protein